MTTIQERLAAAGLEVKPLEWEVTSWGDAIADGGYRIQQLGYSFRLYRHGNGVRSFKSWRKAKAAAQADHTARILAALQVKP